MLRPFVHTHLCDSYRNRSVQRVSKTGLHTSMYICISGIKTKRQLNDYLTAKLTLQATQMPRKLPISQAGSRSQKKQRKLRKSDRRLCFDWWKRTRVYTAQAVDEGKRRGRVRVGGGIVWQFETSKEIIIRICLKMGELSLAIESRTWTSSHQKLTNDANG